MTKTMTMPPRLAPGLDKSKDDGRDPRGSEMPEVDLKSKTTFGGLVKRITEITDKSESHLVTNEEAPVSVGIAKYVNWQRLGRSEITPHHHSGKQPFTAEPEAELAGSVDATPLKQVTTKSSGTLGRVQAGTTVDTAATTNLITEPNEEFPDSKEFEEDQTFVRIDISGNLLVTHPEMEHKDQVSPKEMSEEVASTALSTNTIEGWTNLEGLPIANEPKFVPAQEPPFSARPVGPDQEAVPRRTLTEQVAVLSSTVTATTKTVAASVSANPIADDSILPRDNTAKSDGFAQHLLQTTTEAQRSRRTPSSTRMAHGPDRLTNVVDSGQGSVKPGDTVRTQSASSATERAVVLGDIVKQADATKFSGDIDASINVAGQETHFALGANQSANPFNVSRQLIDAISLADDLPSATKLRAPGHPGGPPIATTPLKVLNIQLQPKELGEVAVRIALRGEKIEVRVQVARQATADLLVSEQKMLLEALQRENFDVESVTINRAEIDRNGGGSAFTNNGQNRSAQGEYQTPETHDQASHQEEGSAERSENSEPNHKSAQEQNDLTDTDNRRSGILL